MTHGHIEEKLSKNINVTFQWKSSSAVTQTPSPVEQLLMAVQCRTLQFSVFVMMLVHKSSPVSFNLCNISHSSHTEPEILSVQSSGYGASNGGLSYTWRTIEAQNLSLGGATQLTHRNELLQTNAKKVRFCRINSMRDDRHTVCMQVCQCLYQYAFLHIIHSIMIFFKNFFSPLQ